jgi:hypothetical protein
MTKDLFEGAFVGAGSTGSQSAARTDFHRRGFEQKAAKETKTNQELGFQFNRSEGPST